MNLTITIRTTEPEALDLPLGLSQFKSDMVLVSVANEKHLGTIYGDTELELNNLRKLIENMPQAYRAIESYCSDDSITCGWSIKSDALLNEVNDSING